MTEPRHRAHPRLQFKDRERGQDDPEDRGSTACRLQGNPDQQCAIQSAKAEDDSHGNAKPRRPGKRRTPLQQGHRRKHDQKR